MVQRLWCRAAGVAAVGLVLLASMVHAQDPPAPAAKPEDRTVPRDDPRATEADALIARFGAAIRSGDAKGAAACFDPRRLLIEALRHTPVVRGVDVRDPEFVAGIQQGLANQFTSAAGLWRFERHQLRRLERGRDGGSLIATVRTWDQDEFAQTGRWWMHRTADGWRLFDHDEFNAGIRMSAEMGVNLAALSGGNMAAFERRAAAAQGLMAACARIGSGDDASVRKEIEAMDARNLSPLHQRVRHMMLGSLAVGAGEPEAAWRHLDAYDGVQDPAGPEEAPLPVVQLLRATACLLSGTLERGEQEIRAYLARVGDDANGLHILGAIQSTAGRPADAASTYRLGLADDPANADCLAGLAGVLPDGAKAELADHAARVPRLPLRFGGLAEPVLARRDAEGLAALVEGLRRVAATATDVDYYGAHVHLLREEWARAATRLKQAWPRAPEAERPAFVHFWCIAMARSGKALEAYQEAPDGAGSFATIAGALLDARDGAMLERLSATHRKAHADDAELPYWESQAAALRGDHATAVARLAPHVVRYLADERMAAGVEGRWIRSLCAVRRFDEAMAAAKGSTARDGDPWFEAVVHAAQGNPEGAGPILRAAVGQGADVALLYADDIVGPALRSPAFAKLREEFPPPPAEAPPKPAAGG